jgi:alkanesulfonate monooxygenase SsuD/methylene tetrahydromethanopterin reductase-like flavin-dependent oxidoreductase (luciferase family)
MAQRSPVALLGTPHEVVDELSTRIEQTGMTHHILLPMSAESHALFVSEIMPVFV